MTNINMYQDGNDLVIVFKNCTPDMKAMLEGFLQPALHSNSGGQNEKGDQSEPKITFGRYKNLTPTEILKQDGDMGYANLMYILIERKVDLSAEEWTLTSTIVESYFHERIHSFGDPYKYAEEATDEEVENFFKYFAYEFSGTEEKELLESTGCSDLKAYRKNVSIETKRGAMAQIMEKMQR